MTEDTDFWFKAYKMFKHGFLPNKNGWLEQSNKLIEMITFIDGEITKHQKEVEEKNARKQSRNNAITR